MCPDHRPVRTSASWSFTYDANEAHGFRAEVKTRNMQLRGGCTIPARVTTPALIARAVVGGGWDGAFASRWSGSTRWPARSWTRRGSS